MVLYCARHTFGTAVYEATGNPALVMKDIEEDLPLPVWAGVIPLELQPAPPVADDGVDRPPPPYASDYRRLT